MLIHKVQITQALQAAVRQGVITGGQAESLLPMLIDQPVSAQQVTPAAEAFHREEPLKFLNNLGDVFIAIGIIFITITALGALPLGWVNLLPIAGYLVLSEWLVKERRMLMPGMVIIVSILLFIGKIMPYGSVVREVFDSSDVVQSGRQLAQYSLLACSAAGALYFWRYRLPFSVAASVFMLLMWILLLWQPSNLALTIWLCGLMTFMLAMIFDSRDTCRVSYVSDAGFWLHFLAAPMITHGFIIMVTSSAMIDQAPFQYVVMGFYLLLMFISLLVDRRAILLASITYFILMLTGVISGGISNLKPSLVLLLIGVLVVLMGGFWYSLRRTIFGGLAATPLGRWVPDLAQERVG